MRYFRRYYDVLLADIFRIDSICLRFFTDVFFEDISGIWRVVYVWDMTDYIRINWRIIFRLFIGHSVHDVSAGKTQGPTDYYRLFSDQ